MNQHKLLTQVVRMLVEKMESGFANHSIKEDFFYYSVIAIAAYLIYIGLAEIYSGITLFYSSYLVTIFGSILLAVVLNYKKLNISTPRLTTTIIIFTVPLLSFRILTTNGFNASSSIWFLIIYMYAHYFLSDKWNRFAIGYILTAIMACLAIEYYYMDFWKTLHASYPFFLSTQITIINFGFLGFYMFLYRSLEKRFQEKIQFQEQMLENTSKLAIAGELAGNIAHEINTPLSTINLTLESLKKSVERDHFIYPQLETLERVTFKIDRIIKSTLKNFGSDNEELQDISVIELLVSLEETFSEKMIRHQIDFKIENDLPLNEAIYCRPLEIEQCLANLINNSIDAIKYKEEPWVRLKLYNENDSKIAIEIRDSGNGINHSTQKNMFTPYFTTKRLGQGTGIGLPLVMKLTEKNQGEIHYLNEEKNTTFKLTLMKVLGG